MNIKFALVVFSLLGILAYSMANPIEEVASIASKSEIVDTSLYGKRISSRKGYLDALMLMCKCQHEDGSWGTSNAIEKTSLMALALLGVGANTTGTSFQDEVLCKASAWLKDAKPTTTVERVLLLSCQVAFSNENEWNPNSLVMETFKEICNGPLTLQEQAWCEFCARFIQWNMPLEKRYHMGNRDITPNGSDTTFEGLVIFLNDKQRIVKKRTEGLIEARTQELNEIMLQYNEEDSSMVNAAFLIFTIQNLHDRIWM